MKRLFLVVVIWVILGVALSQQVCSDQLYRQYLKNFSKLQPTDAQQWAGKKAKFCQALILVEETNNNKNLTYTLAINQFSDLIEKQIQKFRPQLSKNRPTASKKSVGRVKVGVNAASLNWNTLGKVTSVKDQGQCGSCWAFTSVALYESFLLFKGAPSYDLSQQYVLECTNPYAKTKMNKIVDMSCQNGGIMDTSSSLPNDYGIPLQVTFPYMNANYAGVQQSITDICDATDTIMYNADPSVTNLNYYAQITNQELKTLLNEGGPVGVGIWANDAFSMYSSGVFTGCGSSFATSYSSMNHYVLLVGYDASGNWIIKNSYNSGWGQNGYMTVSVTNNCGITGQTYQHSSSAAYSGSTEFTVTQFFTGKWGQHITQALFWSTAFLVGIMI